MRLPLFAMLCLAAFSVSAAEVKSQKGDVILSDPAQGRTMGRVDGETIMLQKTPTGTIGKMGKDKVIVHSDGQGNSFGKVGNQKMFCHTDRMSGMTLCK